MCRRASKNLSEKLVNRTRFKKKFPYVWISQFWQCKKEYTVHKPEITRKKTLRYPHCTDQHPRTL